MDNLSEEIILRYLNRECTQDDLKAVYSWIGESKDNEHKLFELEETFHSGKLERFSQSDFLEMAKTKLYKRLEREEHIKTKRIFMSHIWGYAAMLAVVAGCALGFSYFFRHSDSLAVEELTVSVAANAPVKEITLPDGTKVWLNQSSILKYPKSFSDSRRNVFVEGEAYFEVTKDKKRPFVVKSEDLQVKVLGTRFNLKSNKGAQLAETSLLEGEVEVSGNNNEGMVVLSPGQKAELNKLTGKLHVRQSNTKLDAIWRNNLIPFEKATIFEIAKTLEQFYDVKIILSPNINANTYSGSLPRRGSVDSVLNSLKNSIPIKYQITGKNVYIQSSK